MAENASLLRQLANRAKRFHSQSGVTQCQMARAVGMTDGNYCAFLSNRKGIGSEATCLLLKYTAMSPREAVAAFSKPVFSASIINLQENGQRLRFENSGWLAQEGNSAADPSRSGTDITTTPRARTDQVADLTSVFQDLDYVTRKTVIDAFIAAHAASNTIPTTQKFKRKR